TADTWCPAVVNPIDKEVEIEGQPFRVIGVLEKRKDALQGGSNPNDNVAEIPIGPSWRLHPKQKFSAFAEHTFPHDAYDFVNRSGGGGCWRYEHHAGVCDRAYPGDRRPESDRRHAAKYP